MAGATDLDLPSANTFYIRLYGYRRVCKWIWKHTEIRVNRKRVLRVMHKIEALAQIRRRCPYTHYKEAAHRYENLLNR